MNRRTKVLFAVVLVAAAGFVVDKLATSLWWEPWKKTGDEIADVDKQLRGVNRTVAQEKRIAQEWKEIRDLLDKPREPDVQNHFLEHLRQICDKVGTTFNYTAVPPGKQGDFKEYVVDFKLQLTWDRYVSLVEELHNSRDLLRILKINIGSQYDREDRMDVDLKVSTIEFAAGAK